MIKSVRLEYSNGTHSNFILNAWETKNGFVDVDEKVINKTYKIGSIINKRPLFTALLICVIAANIALPLGLLVLGDTQTFYQNPLSNNIGLSLLMGVALYLYVLGILL